MERYSIPVTLPLLQRRILLYCRLSQDDALDGESNSITNQELLCRGWFLPPNTYDCGSFVVNRKAVVGKESKKSYNRWKSTQKELNFMKSIFEEMDGTYRQVGDYFIPNLVLPDDGEYQIGKYGRMRRSYLKKYRKILDPLTNAKKLPKPAVVPAE